MMMVDDDNTSGSRTFSFSPLLVGLPSSASVLTSVSTSVSDTLFDWLIFIDSVFSLVEVSDLGEPITGDSGFAGIGRGAGSVSNIYKIPKF